MNESKKMSNPIEGKKSVSDIIDGILASALRTALAEKQWDVVLAIACELSTRGSTPPAVEPPTVAPTPISETSTRRKAHILSVLQGVPKMSLRSIALIVYGDDKTKSVNKVSNFLTLLKREGSVANVGFGEWAAARSEKAQ